MPPDLPPPELLPPDWLPLQQSPTDKLPPDQPHLSTSPILIDHGLEVYVPTRSITVSMYISEFTWPQPRSASPNLLNYRLQVHLWVPSISQSPSASQKSFNPDLQVHLLVHWIPQSASPSSISLDPSLLVCLWVHSISVSKCISKHPWSWPPSTFSRSDGGYPEMEG